MLKYKIDVLQTLKDKGYNTYVIRKDNIFGQSTIQKLKDGNPEDLNCKTLGKLCDMLQLQPGDIIENVQI